MMLCAGLALAGVGLLLSCPLMWANSYLYQSLDAPGSYMTAVYGINDSGETIGTFNDIGTYAGHGFSEINGVFTTLSSVYDPVAINNYGQILAISGGILGPDGVFEPIAVPPGTFPNPPGYQLSVYFNEMNDADQIVGHFTSLHLEGEGTGGIFLYSNSTFTILQAPAGFTFTSIAGINNAGQIIGSLTDSNNSVSGFIDNNGVFTTFELPPIGRSFLTGVDDVGDIIGNSSSGGFVIESGGVTPIDFPGSSYTYVYGINNKGQIVGFYADYDESVFEHGFLATPVDTPEPASLLLFGFGFASILVLRRRLFGIKIGVRL